MDRLILAKTHLCTCITLFCTFLSRRCTTTTWKCLISRFVGDGNTRQQLPFSFPELWCSPLEFNSKTFANICWIKRDGISAITFEAAQIHFLSDVFVAVAVVVACLGGGCRGCAPLPEMTCGFLIQLVFCKKKNTRRFTGFEVEQETSAPPPKKDPGSAPGSQS